MKIQFKSLLRHKSPRLITRFGRARLVCLPNGSVELRGAHAHDRTAAKEWVSLFMHEAVPRFAD